jgi:hypothetical protein
MMMVIIMMRKNAQKVQKRSKFSFEFKGLFSEVIRERRIFPFVFGWSEVKCENWRNTHHMKARKVSKNKGWIVIVVYCNMFW